MPPNNLGTSSTEVSSFNLLWFRSLYMALLAISIPRTDLHTQIFAEQYIMPFNFDYYKWTVAGTQSSILLEYLFAATLFVGALNIYPRTAAFIAAVLSYFYYAPLHEFTAQGAMGLVFFTLMAFAFMDLKRSTTKKIPSWYGDFFILMIGTAYFMSAYSKLISSIGWFDGEALIASLKFFYVLNPNSFLEYLVLHPMLITFSGILILIFEFTFVFAIFNRKLRSFFIVAGVLFHLAIFVTTRLNFLTVFGLSYLVFCNWERVYTFFKYKFTAKKTNQQTSPSGPSLAK